MQSLEEFYADPRRRDSREVRFGSGWRSSRVDSFDFVLFWVADTQELCLLRSPKRDVQSDGAFSRFVLHLPPHANVQPLQDGEVVVEVLAILSEDRLTSVLGGWQDHVTEAGGLEWLREALGPRRKRGEAEPKDDPARRRTPPGR